jgi:hypothetical protein
MLLEGAKVPGDKKHPIGSMDTKLLRIGIDQENVLHLKVSGDLFPNAGL